MLVFVRVYSDTLYVFSSDIPCIILIENQSLFKLGDKC